MSTLPTDHRVCPPWCDYARCVSSATGIHHRSHLAQWYANRAEFALGLRREDTREAPGFAELFLAISSRSSLPGIAIQLRPDEARELAQRLIDIAQRAETDRRATITREADPGLPGYLRDLAGAAEEIGTLRYWLTRAMDLVENADFLTTRQRQVELREITRALRHEHRP